MKVTFCNAPCKVTFEKVQDTTQRVGMVKESFLEDNESVARARAVTEGKNTMVSIGPFPSY